MDPIDGVEMYDKICTGDMINGLGGLKGVKKAFKSLAVNDAALFYW